MTLFDTPRFGSSYYPPHHDPQDWPRDVARMAEAGLDTIRTAELLASWDRIEIAPHRYDFGWLDRIFDLAGEHGIGILLGTGSCCPPIWMVDAYADLQVVSRDGVPYPTGSMWSWACKDHPGYRVELQRWLEVLADRYGDRPELLAWQIDNEPGYPFVKRVDRESMDLYCYCPHTAHAFREWLRERYDSPEALSDAWRWDPTHHRYEQWLQVQPPRSLPVEWGPVTAWMDWRRFVADDLAAWIAWQRDLLADLTPDVPTSTNGFIWSRHDPFGVLMGHDPWRLARTVDAIGYDLYPGIGQRFLAEPEYVGVYLDYARSSARRADVELWLPELESGPINGWVTGPDHATTADDIVRLNADGLGAGSTVMLYQGYREWNCIPIHWGALVDLHGRPTDRLDAAGAVATAASDDADLLLHATADPAPVALLHDFDNAVALQGMEAADELLEAIRGAYRALAGRGFEVQFVAYDDLDALDCRLLVCPFTMVLPAGAGAAIDRYVQHGGHLLTFAKSAMLDGRGWLWDTRPGAGLDAVLGVTETTITSTPDPVPLTVGEHDALPGWSGGTVTGDLHRQDLAVGADVDVVGTYDDGGPALTVRRHGAGAAWAVGTHLDLTVARRPADGAADLLAAIARHAGATPLWTVRRDADGLPRVWARLRRHDDGALLTVTSTMPRPATAAVHVVCDQARDLLDGSVLKSDGDGLHVDVPARGARILALDGVRADGGRVGADHGPAGGDDDDRDER